jgi:DNA-binding response OmpR family regulator
MRRCFGTKRPGRNDFKGSDEVEEIQQLLALRSGEAICDRVQGLRTGADDYLLREKILKQVWREQPFITSRTVDVHIAWLRQKLEDQPQSPKHILTVRGQCYRFNR